MSKKAISLVLAIMLTVSMFTVTALNVDAEVDENPAGDNYQSYISEPTTAAQTVDTTQSSEPTAPSQTSGGLQYPNLTVNAISNYFPKAAAEYNATTKEVTVTYWLKLTKNILNTQWYITYDSSILSVSEKKNTPASICPSIGANGALNLSEKDRIEYNATSLRLFDFTSQKVPFVKIVFDVKDLDEQSSVTTTVDLTVDVLKASKVNSDTLLSIDEEEVPLVNNCEIVHSQQASMVKVDDKTTLTNSNFVTPTTVENTYKKSGTPDEGISHPSTADQSTPTEPTESTTANVVADATSASATQPESTITQNPVQRSLTTAQTDAVVNTGDTFLAAVFLLVLIVATAVLFIMRKREMF